MGRTVRHAEALRRDGLEPVLDAIPADARVSIALDVDVLDLAEMPAVLAPAYGGLHYRQLCTLFRSLGAIARSRGR